MPNSVSILIVITLVLHLLLKYFIRPLVPPPDHPNWNDACLLAALVVIVVLVLWFAPIHLPTLHLG